MPCNWSLDWEGKEKERRKHARKHLFDLVKPGNWRCLIINQVMFALNHSVFEKQVVFEGDRGQDYATGFAIATSKNR